MILRTWGRMKYTWGDTDVISVTAAILEVFYAAAVLANVVNSQTKIIHQSKCAA